MDAKARDNKQFAYQICVYESRHSISFLLSVTRSLVYVYSNAIAYMPVCIARERMPKDHECRPMRYYA